MSIRKMVEAQEIDDLAMIILNLIDWPKEKEDPDRMSWATPVHRMAVSRKIAENVMEAYDEWLQTSVRGKNRFKRLVERSAINEEWE